MGDRVGVCVTQLDPGLIERGLACAPGTVPTFTAAVAAVEKIRFFAGKARGGQRGGKGGREGAWAVMEVAQQPWA